LTASRPPAYICEAAGRSRLCLPRESRFTVPAGERHLSNDVAPPRLQTSKIRRAALIFVIGSIAILTVTVMLTSGRDTWQAVAKFGGGLLVVLFAIETLRMVVEAMGLHVLVNGTQGGKISAIEALELTVESYFVGQLIPLSAAGVPYQAYLLTTKGVKGGWASAIVVVKGFVPGVFFAFVLIGTIVLRLLGWHGPERVAKFLNIVGPLSALPIGFLVTLLIVIVRNPRLTSRIIDGVTSWLADRFHGKRAERIREARQTLLEQSHTFREALAAMAMQKRWPMIAGMLLIVAALLVEFMVAVVILWGFGYTGSALEPMVLQSLLKPLIAATPTPGSLGVGEGGYIGFFATFLQDQYVGVSLVLWRLVLYFAPMLVGGLLVARRIGRGFVLGKRKGLDDVEAAEA
jgi:glycosyltransferase 2 family protein